MLLGWPAWGAPALVTLATLNTASGTGPEGTLYRNGSTMIGTAAQGGANGLGTIFTVNIGTGALTTLVNFNSTNGANPRGGLVAVAGGDLWGTTDRGGANNVGTMFKLRGSTLTTVTSLDGTTGNRPKDSLSLDRNDDLFGTTTQGGASGRGTLMRIDALTGGPLLPLKSFDFGSAAANGHLVGDADGNLYGTATVGGGLGGGCLFKVTNDGWGDVTVVAPLSNPVSSLAIDSAGNIYGTTYEGGSNGMGSVFRVAAGTDTVTVLASFALGNHPHPLSRPLVDDVGNVFGTTVDSVYKVDATSHAITTLATFNGTTEQWPLGGLIADEAGNLYGTTSGTVFEITGSGFGVVNPEPGTMALLAFASLPQLSRRGCRRTGLSR